MQQTRRTGFDAHDLARDAAILVLQLVRRAPPTFRALTDQTVRAVTSVPLNLAEGAGRCGRDRIHHWRIAYGSAKEVDTHLRLLAEAGAIDVLRATSAMNLFDEVRAVTWRLLHPQS